MENFDVANAVLAIVPILLAITIQEAAQAYMAKYCGDHTAESLGRVTFNPLVHIDLVGTIIVPFVMLISGAGFIFGWAKPVPINIRNFKNARIGQRLVSISGPISNIIMMFIWIFIFVGATYLPVNFQLALGKMAILGITINAIFCILNMIPILPLNGGRFVDSFLSPAASLKFRKIEPYGIWILLALIFTGVLSRIIHPILALVLQFAGYLVNLLS